MFFKPHCQQRVSCLPLSFKTNWGNTVKQFLKILQMSCLMLGLSYPCYSTEKLLDEIIENPSAKTIQKFLDVCDQRDKDDPINLNSLPKDKRNKAFYAVIDQFEDCQCVCEYWNFPWNRNYSTAGLQFFAKLPQVDLRKESDDGPWWDDEYKLKAIAQVHWTMSTGPRKLDTEIDALKVLYALGVKKRTLTQLYFEMKPTLGSRITGLVEIPVFFTIYGLNDAFATPLTRYAILGLLGWGAFKCITG